MGIYIRHLRPKALASMNQTQQAGKHWTDSQLLFWQKLTATVTQWSGRVSAKSLYRSHVGSHFYGKKCEIWADFGPVGNTENKIGPIMSNF